MSKKIAEKSDKKKHPGIENLTPGGPGRPKGQRNYRTIYREALKKLASKKGIDPDELETDMLLMAISKARKADLGFYKDVMDRLHGKPTQKTEQDIKLDGGVVVLPSKDEN